MKTSKTTVILFLFVTLAMCGIFICGCSGGGSRDGGADAGLQQPGQEDGGTDAKRVLKVYTALDPSESKIYFSEYEKKTGVKIQWVRMSSGAVLARVLAEKKNQTMGMWLGGSSTDFIAAAQEDLLEPFRPDIDFELTPQMHDPDWKWTGFYFGAVGFAANTRRLELLGMDPPDSWADLLDPRFKGEIGVAYPYTSGTAYTLLSTLVQLMGEEEAFEYIAKLDKNVHHYNKSGSACVTQAGLGEVAIGISFSHDILKKGPSRGYPVVLTFPTEGTGYEIGAMALIKNGPGHDEARKFINWMLSTESQNLMQRWFRIPLNPNAEVIEGAITADQLNLIEDDAVWAGSNKERLVERWRLITAQ